MLFPAIFYTIMTILSLTGSILGLAYYSQFENCQNKPLAWALVQMIALTIALLYLTIMIWRNRARRLGRTPLFLTLYFLPVCIAQVAGTVALLIFLLFASRDGSPKCAKKVLVLWAEVVCMFAYGFSNYLCFEYLFGGCMISRGTLDEPGNFGFEDENDDRDLLNSPKKYVELVDNEDKKPNGQR